MMSLTCVTCYLTSQIIPLKTARFLEYHILLGGSRSHNLLVTSADCLWILRGTSTQPSELLFSLCKQVCSPGKTCRVVAGFWHAMLSTGSNSQKAKWSSSREIYSFPTGCPHSSFAGRHKLAWTRVCAAMLTELDLLTLANNPLC